MNRPLHYLIPNQQRRMRELRDDGHDLANVVADDVWDKFEVEIEDATVDGYIFDLAAGTQMALTGMLVLIYDEAFEGHVLGLFDRLKKDIREAGAGGACFDNDRIDLTGLRKSLKLRRHADDLVGQAIERAKPRLIGRLFPASDPGSDAWDREHREHARRVRNNLLGLREQIARLIWEEASIVIQTARLAYINMLDSVGDKAALSRANACAP